jgi:RNA polymerase sigma factor (sigma-70 family)
MNSQVALERWIQMNRSTVRTRVRESRFADLRLLTDAELVDSAKNDSPEAFQVLADRYEALVRSVAAKYLERDLMAVEDVCQETFLRALVKLGDLRDGARFRSWICMIARNQALDTSRKHTAVISWESEDDEGNLIQWEIPDLRANPADAHARAEAESVMRDVMRGIPEMYLEPISLRYDRELDYEEIAAELDKPLGTVKSLIHRGKVLIRKEFERRTWGVEGAHVLAGRA